MNNTVTKPNKDSLLEAALYCNDSITSWLETAFNEPIALEVLMQQQQIMTEREWQAIDDQETILQRTSILTGASSKVRYLYAHSLIRLKQLDADMTAALFAQKLTIGKLLEYYQLPIARRLITIKAVNSLTLQAMLNTKQAITMRVYELAVDDSVTMLIREYYPNAVYASTA